MKAYTDLEQSRELSKILPLESADMYYNVVGDAIIGDYQSGISSARSVAKAYKKNPDEFAKNVIPCWSLAALLAVLPNEIIIDNRFESHYQIDMRKYDGGDNTTLYQIAYGNDRGSSGSWHDMINTGEKEHLIDACFQMIINLNELKML